MRLINADKGYEVLDKLFAKIQRNDYAVTQDMLDEAWKEWCMLPTAYDVDKVVEQLEEYREEIGDVITDIIDVVKEGGVNE